MDSKQIVIPDSLNHPGTYKGEFRTVGEGIQTYYCKPPNGSMEHALLFITDSAGHTYPYNKLLADAFAENGFFVVMPDLFRGDSTYLLRTERQRVDIHAWYRNHLPQTVEPVVERVLQELRNTPGIRTLCAVGYCLGAKYVCRLLSNSRSASTDPSESLPRAPSCFVDGFTKQPAAPPVTVTAGFIAHPVYLTTEEVLGVAGPLSIALGSKDKECSHGKALEIECLLKKTDAMWEIAKHSWGKHGFAVNAESGRPEEVFAKEQAFVQAMRWCKFHITSRHDTLWK